TAKKNITDLSETVRFLGYDTREVRDGVTRGSNTGSRGMRTKNNERKGAPSHQCIPVHIQKNRKRIVKPRDVTFSGFEHKIREGGMESQRKFASWGRVKHLARNFHKRLTKNPKDETVELIRLGEWENEVVSENEEEIASSEARDYVNRHHCFTQQN
ncbi:8568_t:CDS:2, partial [Ambispora gerdemannii]